MISVGNDIVALNKVNKHSTSQPAYYSKILSVSEQTLYWSGRCPELAFEHYVWLLWSVKESAYKYLKRNKPDLIFSPAKIVVDEIELYGDEHFEPGDQKYFKGTVVGAQHKLFFKSKINAAWIASVVNGSNDFNDVYWQVENIERETYPYQSATAKRFLLDKLRTLIPGDLTLEKNPVGYPEIKSDNKKLDMPASIAHHGLYISYDFNLAAFAPA